MFNINRIVTLLVGMSLVIISGSCVAAEDSKPLKAGVIGLDAHAATWARILNNPEAEGKLAEITIVAGYPGGSPDIPQSVDLLKKGIATFEDLDIELVDSVDELLKMVDVVMILSIDGRPHLEYAKQVFESGKRVFIDKPMAGSLADAIEIFRLAKEKNVPCFTSSCLRFSPGTQAVLESATVGAIRGCNAHSPCSLEPHHPDFFWYGIHGVETLFTIMGPGCETVTRVQTDNTDLAVGQWNDGRIGTFRGHRSGPHGYGATVFGANSIVEAGKFEGYEPLLEEIVKFFQTGKPPVSAAQTLEILAFMEAADSSKEQGGQPVKIETVMKKAQQTR